MKRLGVAFIVLLFSATAQAQFSRVVRTVERSTGINRTYIPFLSIARSFIRTVEPQGVFDFRLAVFEGGGRRDHSVNFDREIRRAMGGGWSQVVKASKRGAESAYVFARPTRRGMRLMIVATERNEAAVIEVEVDPRKFARIIREAQVHVGRNVRNEVLRDVSDRR